MTRFIALLSATVLIAVIILLGYKQITRKKIIAILSPSAPLVEEIMIDAKAIQFNNDGKIAQQLNIQKIFHAKGEGFTHFVKPQVTLNQADGSSWKLSANTGKSIHTATGDKFSEIELSGRVEINQINHDAATWQLLTESMMVYPKTKKLYTSAPVRLDNQAFSISGEGLTGDLNTQKIIFLKNVKSQYNPQKKS